MIEFIATIKKFASQGEKTGWTYIEIPADLAQKLKPGNRQSFRVKGKLDAYRISGIALIPMGAGDFIMSLNADMRKAIGKKHGSMLKVQLAEDNKGFVFNKDFMDCLDDEPKAKRFFKTLSGSHQRYFSKWIDSAKTEPTKIKRITMAVNALVKEWGYPQMLRASKGS
jgi:hypothetical protein